MEQAVSDLAPAGASNEEQSNTWDSVANTIRENPVIFLAAGAALFALTRTSAGRFVKPALSLAVSSGAASALASAVIKQASGKGHR